MYPPLLRILCATWLYGSSCFALAEAKTSYMTYCSGCHGADGKGLAGQFPPLAGSDWVKGDVRRTLQIILHGLSGTIHVSGNTYDLSMPPQGQSLSDEEIVEIVNYIRSAWDIKEKPIDIARVKKARELFKDRSKRWDAKELLKLYPLPWSRPKVLDLHVSAYQGTFTSFPNYSKLEPATSKHFQSALIDPKQAGLTGAFSAVWEGKVEINNAGEYVFLVSAESGARVFVNGEKVAQQDPPGNIDRIVQGEIALEKGYARIRIEYLHAAENGDISFGLRPKTWSEAKTYSVRELRYWPEINLIPEQRPKIYRNFIKGQQPRSIAVGFANGLSFAYNADNMGLAMLWQAGFMDAGRHWTGRGKGFEAPAGEDLVNLGNYPLLAKFSDAEKWPKKTQKQEIKFKGYRLDKHGNPTFILQVQGALIYDQFKAKGKNRIERRITVENTGAFPDNLHMRLSKDNYTAVKKNRWNLSDKLQLKASGSSKVQEVNGQLQLPITTNTKAKIIYTWR